MITTKNRNEQAKNKKLSTFLWKAFLLLVPLLFLSLFYIIYDPFNVIYKNYNFENYYDHQPYELNREYISTELLMKNKDIYHYDSFIMGSCESYVYHADEWKKYIKTNGEVFHYPAASETLYGVYSKIKFLDKNHIPIKNCLLIMDISTFKGIEPRHDYIHASHPDVSGESEISFQVSMFKNYFSNLFSLQYVDYKLTGKIKGYMKNNFGIYPGQIRTTLVNNEFYYEKYDTSIKKDSTGFYAATIKNFYFRDTLNKRKMLTAVIQNKQKLFLEEMYTIFTKNNTRYKIVLSPMYDQVYFNEEDIQTLKRIFGQETIFDYSGINKYTNDIKYYYDNFHYKPNLANKLLKEIYSY